jgi:protein-tyrosine-phosphatase
MPHYNVLFLCTGNSARSGMAEAIMNWKGRENFTAYSAGSHPAGIVRPEALRQIESANLSIAGLHSKSWDEYAKPDAPVMNFVFTVCHNAANEVCPIWLVSPSQLIGECLTLLPYPVHRRNLTGRSRKHSPSFRGASPSCFLYRSQV